MNEDHAGAVETTFVGTAGTADAMTRAHLLHAHQRVVVWACYALVLVGVTCIAFAVVDRTTDVGGHVLRSMSYAAPFTLLLLATGIIRGYGRVRRRVVQDVAVGTELSSAFGHDEFTVRSRAGTQRIPYTAVKSLAVRGECAVISTHGSPMPWLLPSALFPDEVVTRIRGAAAAGGPHSPVAARDSMPPRPAAGASAGQGDGEAGEQIALEHRYVADGESAVRAARAHVRAMHGRPTIWIVHLGLFLVVLTMVTGPLRGPDEGLSVAMGATFSALLTGLFGWYTAVVSRRATTRNMRATIFEGAVLETGFGERGYVISGPFGRRYVPYSRVESVDRWGDFTSIRLVDDPVRRLNPSVLFPDEALERFRNQAGQ